MAILDDLERLARLHERGLLTDEEFESQKHILLNRSASDTDSMSDQSHEAQSHGDKSNGDHLENPDPGTYRSNSEIGNDGRPRAESSSDATDERAAKNVASELRPRGKFFRRFTYLCLGLIVAYAGLKILLSTSTRDTIHNAVIQRPEPVVVWQHCNDDGSSLFEYRTTVTGKVRNNGAAGYVAIIVTVTQGRKEFHRRDRRYLRNNEEADVSFTFDEPEASGGSIQCSVDAVSAEY